MSTPVKQSPLRRALAAVRNTWRSLTSMKTALVLLFLLAVAAMPGALLPQRDVDSAATAKWIDDHGTLGEIMDKLQFFGVFKSVWFTSIYALLFVSLVGCILPRTVEHFRALRTSPVATPRNLSRLPRHTTRESDEDPEAAAQTVLAGLRGWRKIARPGGANEAEGTVTVSAEKGYLREAGNLIFHISLVGILIAIGVGQQFSYEGSRIVIAGDDGFCNTSSNYDNFRAGNLVDGTGLAPFCLKADEVQATFLPNAQPDMFRTLASYQDGEGLRDDTWKKYDIEVNKPLRMDGVRIYMLGHGYAGTFTVTYPNGAVRTQTMQFAPQDKINFLSSGALRFDPPAELYRTEDERRTKQIGIEGLLAPTKQLDGTLLTSRFPAPNDPAVAVDIYEGDTGLDTGKPQNIFSLSRDQIDSGRLSKKARVNLSVGQSTTIEDGTQVRFDGVTNFAALQVSHNPAQNWTLVFAIGMLGGLIVSLTVRRRRVFVRLTPREGGGTVMEIAGLARTDQAGWTEDFEALADRLVGPDGEKVA
ncbi:cytochrome c biogenesis protein ResB [Tsukamurella tyrosinosolvens]|uniref:cytochrome c biogenesis protein ResB n=1 Tax=Tsukamurella tyrosinosolvens TaxID=57704 RepID=UPI00079674BF|nr:cytochrome c biogenesis protein ResB [Tsukamurella tyrosinosolvens]KXP02468.1 cytochrome C biogenesis protein ResB [Tsukamurella tyrosinosolvens]KZL96606.1 cytochrome C biogenesis protein ResB [Tsukamurella tyrosinosolvens]MCA4996502.1 cytochrome c biogenesis protein ResB [Tsukamurella tyrosinosolvens]WEL93865.1 cytochrome c biogenesis protein ResB [Tsukamurella tyrosinosolvens]